MQLRHKQRCEKPCTRLKYVNEAINSGSNIEIIDFDEFLKRLEITEQQLNDMPMISFDCLLRKDAVIKSPRLKKTLESLVNDNNKEEKTDSLYSTFETLGELFPDVFKKIQ